MRYVSFYCLLGLFFSTEAAAQICGISHYPYGYLNMNRLNRGGIEFLKIETDLPFFDESQGRTNYGQLWIEADVLNVRSGPGLEHGVVSEHYFGDLVFAHAKLGDWIAIDQGIQVQGFERPPYWVNIKYVSAQRISNQVEAQILEKRCPFQAFAALKFQWPPKTKGHDPCNSVHSYLTRQRWLSKDHAYAAGYETWRMAQDNPDEMRKLPCR